MSIHEPNTWSVDPQRAASAPMKVSPVRGGRGGGEEVGGEEGEGEEEEEEEREGGLLLRKCAKTAVR